MEKRTYEITLDEGMLGSKPMNPEIYTDFVASKKEDALPKDEIDAAERAAKDAEALEKGMTIFHKNQDGAPIIYDYQIKGFFKSACKALKRDATSKSANMKAYKSIIDGNIFVSPRTIDLELPNDGKVQIIERPLRAQTMQGERVALAKSEIVPAKTKLTFTVATVGAGLFATIEEWLDYGALNGLGQWRNAGYGRFSWKRVDGAGRK